MTLKFISTSDVNLITKNMQTHITESNESIDGNYVKWNFDSRNFLIISGTIKYIYYNGCKILHNIHNSYTE